MLISGGFCQHAISQRRYEECYEPQLDKCLSHLYNSDSSQNPSRLEMEPAYEGEIKNKGIPQSEICDKLDRDPFLSEIIMKAEKLLHSPGSADWKPERDPFVDKVVLKAEKLRKRKLKRAVFLSILKAASFLMLFLALGLLQMDFSLYILATIIGCIILGVSTFLERGT